jgi:two-component system, response regulator
MNSTRSILLVEDSADDCELMRDLFKAAKIDLPLQIAVSGEQAMQLLGQVNEDGAPALVFTDLNMPDGDGFSLLTWVRAQPWHKSTVVVVLSSTRRGGDIDRAYALGADFFLSKFPSPAILAALCTTAEKRSAEAVSQLAGIKRPVAV